MPRNPARIPIRSFDQVVKVLGGTSAAARAINRAAPQICQWRNRGQFPAALYPKVDRALKKLGYQPSSRLFTFEFDDAQQAG